MNPFARGINRYSSPLAFLRTQGGYYSVSEIAASCQMTPLQVLALCEVDARLESREYMGKTQFRFTPEAFDKAAARHSKPGGEVASIGTKVVRGISHD